MAHGDHLELVTANAVADLAALTGWAVDRGADLPGLQVTRPTLEDVYLDLTRDEEAVSPVSPAQ